MSGLIPQHFIDTLLARTDLVELVHNRVPLKKAGKEYKACCPFHDEKTPSFAVVPDKQFYHCFGCGAHGTAISFLMEYDHLSFVEAIEELAAKLSLTVPRAAAAQTTDKPTADQYTVLEQANAHFQRQLRLAPAAIQYLKTRHITGETAAKFGLGFAPDAWDSLLTALGPNEITRQQLARNGLIVARERNNTTESSGYYDRFRHRIMFPIRDARGRIIGFGGRVIIKEEPKYLNSPETELFHKGRELYGLYEARQATRTIERLLVVEGYMDVISLHQAGITYAVATLGTATTPEHLKRLFRVCNEIVFCFDGDRAGRAAAWRALEVALTEVRQDRQLRFLFLPEQQDPDSLISTEGRAAFEQRIAQASSLSDYLLNSLSAQVDINSVEGRAQFTSQIQVLLARVTDQVYRELLLEATANRLAISLDRLRQLVQFPAQFTTPPSLTTSSTPATPPQIAGRGGLVRQAIQNLLHYPQAALGLPALDELAKLDRPGIPLLLAIVNEIQNEPHLASAALLERWRTRPEAAQIVKLFLKGPIATDEKSAEIEVNMAINRIYSEIFPEQRFNELIHKFNLGSLSPEEKAELRALTQHAHKGPIKKT